MSDFCSEFQSLSKRFEAVSSGDTQEANRRVRRVEAAAGRLVARALADGWLQYDYPVDAWPINQDDSAWVIAWRLFTRFAARESCGILGSDVGDTQMQVVSADQDRGVRLSQGRYHPGDWQERAFDYAAVCRMLVDSTPTYLGNGRVRVGERTIALEGNQEAVLEALLNRGGAATLSELRSDTLVDDVPRVLKRIQAKPGLERHIDRPGGRGKGGYRTTISDGR